MELSRMVPPYFMKKTNNPIKLHSELQFFLVPVRFYGLATTNAIASLLFHENESNEIDSERTKKDEEIEPISSLAAQFLGAK
jgi:hypothetical protein